MLIKLFPLAIYLICIGIVWIALMGIRKYYQSKGRRSPFTQKFLRSPGESILWRLQDINMDLDFYVSVAVFFPILFYSMCLSQIRLGNIKNPNFIWLVSMIFGIGVMAYSLVKLFRLIALRRKLRLGLEGEMAVGQELNLLMHDGYHVFHDFPADGFNIDHIVVGKPGVFAVETKARSKPTSGNRTSDAEVVYDGRKLQFPNWVETEPLKQARLQAEWLSKWLSSAVGEQVQARPVIALPGWFVKRTSSEGFPVINPRLFRSIAKPVNGKILSEPQIKRIVHQLDQKCRDVEPTGTEGLGGAPGIETSKK